MKEILFEPHSTRFSSIILLFFSLVLLLSGCRTDTSRKSLYEGDASQKQEAQKPPEAKIFVDDAILKSPHAVIGGTVQNVGDQRLRGLVVEIELRRREDGMLESRNIPVVPSDLKPGERGRYSLKVLSNEWGSSRIASLRSASRADEIAFQAIPGAQRPPERPRGSPNWTKEDARARPSQKARGEEFINTPDTPVSVP